MNPASLRPDDVSPAIKGACAQLLHIEREQGIVRDVQGGLEALHAFGPGSAAPVMNFELAHWAATTAGLNVRRLRVGPKVTFVGKQIVQTPPTDPSAWEIPAGAFAPVGPADVRKWLLPDERFGEPNEDHPSFEPTLQGTAALAARDAALASLCATLGGPLHAAVVVDDLMHDHMESGVFLLVSTDAVLVLVRVGWRG
jgi:hypothetical protein